MRLFINIILFCLIYTTLNADLLKPNPSIKPEEVISIQLSALQKNNTPFDDAGIAQTWEFAHPFNREYTGPLENFISMMYSRSYSIMLDHEFHNIILVSKNNENAFYFIELIDKFGNKFGFQWSLQKVILDGKYKNCWMTIGVSRPMSLSKST
tara:strand:+ start:658 stop:1116 length:459 start_codon:yes stop_codon:yes gene_type:complete